MSENTELQEVVEHDQEQEGYSLTTTQKNIALVAEDFGEVEESSNGNNEGESNVIDADFTVSYEDENGRVIPFGEEKQRLLDAPKDEDAKEESEEAEDAQSYIEGTEPEQEQEAERERTTDEWIAIYEERLRLNSLKEIALSMKLKEIKKVRKNLEEEINRLYNEKDMPLLQMMFDGELD